MSTQNLSFCPHPHYGTVFPPLLRTSALSLKNRGMGKNQETTPFFSILLLYLFCYHMDYIALIGLLAGTCTTVSFLPQVIKTFRLKETRDISLSMYLILAAGIFLWIIYGLLIKDLPVILANSISFALASSILILKIKHG
jgi:MtN3 and saliva related transmembrane protein